MILHSHPFSDCWEIKEDLKNGTQACFQWICFTTTYTEIFDSLFKEQKFKFGATRTRETETYNEVLYTPYISRGFYFREFRESGALREFNNTQNIYLRSRRMIATCVRNTSSTVRSARARQGR